MTAGFTLNQIKDQCGFAMPSSGRISKGVYLLKIDPGCVLSTGLWSLKGLVMREYNVTKAQWTPTALDLEWLKKPINLTQFVKQRIPLNSDAHIQSTEIPHYAKLESEASEVSEIMHTTAIRKYTYQGIECLLI